MPGMLKTSGAQEKGKNIIINNTNFTAYFVFERKIKLLIFLKFKPFLAIKQTSPLGVPMYAFGYPKTKVLAQFAYSKAFFLSPRYCFGMLKTSGAQEKGKDIIINNINFTASIYLRKKKRLLKKLFDFLSGLTKKER